MPFERPHAEILRHRLKEHPAFMIVVSGPRQIGKSFMVRQVLTDWPSAFVATDQPLSSSFDLFAEPIATSQLIPGAEPSGAWLVNQWTQARAQAQNLPNDKPFVLAIDEVQKIPRWSEIVKGLWDSDRAAGLNMHIVLLGSSPWLMQQGLTESLAGRYELIRMSHWSYEEMREAFDFSLEEYVYFGGYPGSAPYIRDERRWRDYIRGSLIHPNIEKDILQMTRVDKPALLKALFELGCGAYSGQILALTKVREDLQDAGNTTTLSHYLELLSQAGLLTGLSKYSVQKHRKRASPPKFNALNTALISALADYTFQEARNDRTWWGRLVESALGAHLCNSADDHHQVHYWREGAHEVDFVLGNTRKLLAIEVKSGSGYPRPKGLSVFTDKFKQARELIVGKGGVSLADFLSHPAEYWLDNV